jgi:hypothetical protein
VQRNQVLTVIRAVSVVLVLVAIDDVDRVCRPIFELSSTSRAD